MDHDPPHPWSIDDTRSRQMTIFDSTFVDTILCDLSICGGECLTTFLRHRVPAASEQLSNLRTFLVGLFDQVTAVCGAGCLGGVRSKADEALLVVFPVHNVRSEEKSIAAELFSSAWLCAGNETALYENRDLEHISSSMQIAHPDHSVSYQTFSS